MRLLVTGASGLVGSFLVRHALQEGATVFAASRDPGRVDWPDGARPVRWPGGDLPEVDAVVHLAGASVGGRRWTDAYMQTLRDSRIETTKELARRLPSTTALVNASAVGYYGRDPQGPCPVDREPGDDFLATLCKDWEAAAREARGRVVMARIGHVLAAGEGLLGRLEPLHRLRVAGILGDGTQSLPWIWAEDLAGLLYTCATTDQEGAVNANAGNVQYGHLHRSLCEHIGGFPALRVPSVALRLRMGRFAPFLLGGQTVTPSKVAGWTPRFHDFDVLMEHLYSS